MSDPHNNPFTRIEISGAVPDWEFDGHEFEGLCQRLALLAELEANVKIDFEGDRRVTTVRVLRDSTVIRNSSKSAKVESSGVGIRVFSRQHSLLQQEELVINIYNGSAAANPSLLTTPWKFLRKWERGS